jgi:hypothetical protein
MKTESSLWRKHVKKKCLGLTRMAQGLYEFPVAGVTNYHTFGGLKPQKFILILLEARVPH